MKFPIIICATVAALLFVAGCASKPGAVQDVDQSGKIYPLNEVDKLPAPRGQRATPVYPLEYKSRGITGEAVIVFVVTTKGTVEQARIVRATHEQFGYAAKAAIQQWKFTPGRKDGLLVNCLMQVPIAFNLNL